MSVFKKKTQIPESITELNKRMSMLLGMPTTANTKNTNSNNILSNNNGNVTRQLILTCAMFWDSKQRIDKIKSLIIKQQQLQTFEDSQDFKIQQLQSIELLSLSKNHIIHLHPIKMLTTLICINVNNNKIYDISPLQKLIKLEQIYAANNQITNIDVLQQLNSLRIVNLYANLIDRVEETLEILGKLKELEEVDIERNPIYGLQSKDRFIRRLRNVVRFNGELIQPQDRVEEDNNISCVVMPSAKFRDTHTSFWKNSPVSTKNYSSIDSIRADDMSISNDSLILTTASNNNNNTNTNKPHPYHQVSSNLHQQISQLQHKYMQIDDKFQQQIVKNVKLKSQYHRILLQNKQKQQRKQQIKQRNQEIKMLKRKVKALKQNLFAGNQKIQKKKGDLLREIFQLELIKIMKVMKKMNSNSKQSDNTAIIKKNMENNNNVWVRKFDYDSQIIIGTQSNHNNNNTKSAKHILNNNKNNTNDDDKYLFDDDAQLEQLLASNTSAIQDLKKQLSQLSAANQ